MAATLISALSIGREKSVLQCCVSRKWTAYSSKKDFKLSVQMILIDKEGNDIWAIIPIDKMRRFEHQLVEQKFYKLSDFTVKDTNETYRPVPNPLLIRFEDDTTIEEIAPISEIPPFKFRFVPPTDIPNHCDLVDDLLDIAGPLVKFSDVQVPKTSANKTPRRDLYILLPDGNPIKVAVWGRSISQLNDILKPPVQPNVVLVVTSLMVKKWNGFYLTSSSATKVYANLNVPGIEIPTARALDSSAPEKIDYQSAPAIQSVTIEEVERLRAVAEKKQTVALDCSVTSIKDGWFYEGCPNRSCRRSLTQTPVAFYCGGCKTSFKEGTKRFRTILTVMDSSGEMDVVLLDHAAEKYLNISANELYINGGSVANPPPPQLLDFLQKEFRLHIGLSEFDFTHPQSKLGVQRIVQEIGTLSTKSTISNPLEGELKRSSSSSLSISTTIASPTAALNDRRSSIESTTEIEMEEDGASVTAAPMNLKRKRDISND